MVISFVVGSLRGGGAERVIIQLAKQFAEEGFKTNILTITDDICDYDVPINVALHFIKPSIKIRGFRVFSRMHALRKVSQALGSDVVISFAGANVVTAFAFWLSKTKVILSERNDPHTLPQNRFSRSLRDFSYRLADALVFQTKDALAYFSNIKRVKKLIIKNPLGLNIPQDGQRVNNCFVNVGRLCEQKNQKLLINAFEIVVKKYPTTYLKIYGKGPLKQELENYIVSKELSSHISLCGHSKNLLDEIKNDKFFVLSSDYEGMSNALLEAMALNMTVISTDHPIGGAREVIKNGENGILVPVKDVKALSDAMINCLSDDKMADMLASNAGYVRDELSLKRIANQWLDLLEDIVNAR